MKTGRLHCNSTDLFICLKCGVTVRMCVINRYQDEFKTIKLVYQLGD